MNELTQRGISPPNELARLSRSVSARRRANVEVRLSARADAQQPIPLSFSQERLWFVEQLGGTSDVQNLSAAIRLEGTLEIEALRRSLEELVSRHEVLRTTFTSTDDQAVQVIHAARSFLLPQMESTSEEELQELLQQESQRSFDLGTGPLFRASLVKLAEHRYLLMLTMHHIVSDGWSIGVLVKEISALYGAFVQGKPSPLAPLPVQYADYALWQRRWLQGEVLQQQLTYWTGQLKGAPPALELPTDRPRPSVASFRGSTLHFQVPKAVAERLSELAKREGATLFMVLMAAYQTLLWRWSGESDVLVGTPIAGRQHREVEGLIGFFVNTLVLRGRLSTQLTFRDYLSQVKETALGAYAHQSLPLEKLVEAIQPTRDLGRQPIFQVWFVLEKIGQPVLDFPGVRVTQQALARSSLLLDMSLALRETSEGLSGALEYATDLFNGATIQRLVDAFQVLLSEIVQDPGRSVADLPMLTPEARGQQLEAYNGAWRGYARDTLVADLFEVQARRTPEALAVVHESQSLTYADLESRANQLAHYLKSLGVGPDVLVGLCVPRSVEMIVGLLGILKAGAAYLPLDAHYPVERLQMMLSESMTPVLLTHSQVRERLPAHWGQEVLLDTQWAEIAARQPITPVTRSANRQSLAYAIYTSGSSGRPKAVLMTQEALSHHMQWMAGRFRLSPQDVVLQKTSLSFDASVWEVLAPLLSGATLALADARAAQEVSALIEACQRYGVTTLQVVPSLLQALLQEPGFWECTTLRQIFSGGEALTGVLSRQVSHRLGECGLHNLYGPTETCIQVLAHTVEELDREVTSVPIGEPIWNTRAYVLDERLRPVPVGVAGELYIAGPALGRGYLNRAGLTAERFVADVWSEEAGARMYRTGDRVRGREDGRLEYLGRSDQQVKVRGFRIELGEIEARLSEVAGVTRAAVGCKDSGRGEPQLVAYVVEEQEGAVEVSRVRDYLRGVLPDYMIPSAFVKLSSLPLTPNGKLDRRALPAPDTSGVMGREYQAPVGEVEQRLAGIWQELLQVPQVGRNDHFFELGGHSLLATQLVSHVRATLGVELALRTIFEAPILKDLAPRVSGSSAVLPGIDVAARPERLPLSFSQERLWFLEQLHEINEAYHIFGAVRLTGELDVEALRRSLEELVSRHEVLRTTFSSVDDQAVQVIHPARSFLLPQMESDSEEHLQELLQQESQRSFDLGAGPLFRASLVKLAEHHYLLMLTMHHIVSDGWSIGVLVKEISALYGAFVLGKPSPLAPLPVQYADYALWQRRWLQGEVLQQQLTYWTGQLKGAPPALELPTDRPRPPVASFRGSTLHFQVPKAVAERLSDLAQREGTTLFMVLMAAYQTLLWRWSGESDVLVGTPIAGRQHREVEGLIGFFVNTLVLRGRLSAQLTFRDYLAQVKETTLAALAHPDLPFEKLVEAIQPARDLARQPIFQVWFVLDSADSQYTPDLPHLKIDLLETTQKISKFDLTLALREMPDGLIGTFEYATDLFDGSTVQHLVDAFQVLLGGIVEDPRQSVADLPMLTPEACGQQLEAYNGAGRRYAQETLVADLFEAQVKRTPEALAVVYEDQRLSYVDLDARANQLAHHLKSLGVGPDVLVGLCVPRSVEMIVGLLGILKAGAAYLPLDAHYPVERLQMMLSESMTPVLLTHSQVRERLPPHWGQEVLLDTQWAEIAVQPLTAVTRSAHRQSLAYAIYTSGSSGRAKAVMMTQEAVSHHMQWMAERFALSPQDVVLQKTSLSFDASVWEVLAPLLSGATLALADAHAPQEVSALIEACQRYGVTTLQVVPSLLQAMLQEPGFRECNTLRQIFSGGEALTGVLSRQVAHRLGECGLHNLYGPTETCIQVLAHTVEELDREVTSVPIGEPIWNTRAYVLDERLKPVPVGVAGELYIAGPALGRGYLNRAGLTAERFVADVWSEEAGARMYRTGDRVRGREDGRLEYLGRSDQQVKVRGFRIELGEIEARLSEIEGLREVAVEVRPTPRGDQQLVAYVVTREGVEWDMSRLRSYLQGALPEYMIPSAFVKLPSLPLTPNGKLDRRALPAPDASGVMGREYQAPVGEVEQRLAGIWQELLQVPQVGRNDHFFELGGHSLLATQLVSHVRATLGVELALRTIFEAPILKDLAPRVSGSSAVLPGIDVAARPERLPLSFSQERLWFLEQLHEINEAYHIFGAVRLTGELDVEALRRSLEELVSRHEVLRTTFSSVDDQAVQVIHPARSFLLPQMESDSEEHLQELLQQESQRSFDLGTGPLFRACLVKLVEHRYLLMLTMHHIVSDGWSIGVLVKEISALYGAFVQGKPSPLAPLPVQYADYALWQRRWLQGEVLHQQLTYWTAQLKGALPALELPTDRPRPPVATFRGSTLHFQVPKEVAERLSELAKCEGTTLFMVLMAAYQTLLWRWSGESDVLVGTPIAGRQHREVEGLIGFFVNTLVLRGRLSAQLTFRDYLAQVKETTLAALAHPDLPFEKLVEALQPVRDLGRQPLAPVQFSLGNAPAPTLELAGLQWSLASTPGTSATFDLNLAMRESGAGLEAEFQYATDLFDRDTVKRLADSLRVLLDAIVENPERAVSQLPLLSTRESRRLLHEFNHTNPVLLRDRAVHELISQQAQLSPATTAVVYEDQRLSYADLDAKSNQLAHYLRSLGVGPDVLVGLCVPRSPEMIIGIVGILKAGAAYLPIDAQYPADRLQLMLNESMTPVLLTHEDLLQRLPSHWAQVVLLDAQWPQIAEQPATAPHDTLQPSNLAYAIYTSGSTGRAKGVTVTHESLTASTAARLRYYGSPESMLLLPAITFDSSVATLFGCLCAGGTLYLPTEGLERDLTYLGKLVERHQIRGWLSVPSLYQATLETVGHRLGSLRTVICAGEALLPTLVKQHLEICHQAALFNEYGPTEGTVWCSVCRVGESAGDVGKITIGAPIANIRACVLDEFLQPVPIGVTGELYIAGPSLARGYLQRPDLTAERFVAEAFGVEGGERMYRTGDLVRWRANGELEFVGRSDHQVKIRGFRIELGEIEARLNGCPGVREAAVAAREDSRGEKQLVAYIVEHEAAGVEAPQLRNHLLGSLPEYMVPGLFVKLPALPLSANGKLDRKALPAPEALAPARDPVAPRDALEQSLAAIWIDILGLDAIAVADDFFALGGHSLAAMQVIARIRDELGVETELRDLFEFTTLEKLAERIRVMRLALEATRTDATVVETDGGVI